MSTPKFRKSDQYYEDEYDRLTISSMKEKEDEWNQTLKQITDEDLQFKKYLTAHLDINEWGAHFAQNKRNRIQAWIDADERKDRLILKHPIPPSPYCSKCDGYMEFSDYDFVENDHEIQFIFSCGKGTRHNKILLANGKALVAAERYCPHCNGTIKSDVKRTKAKITATDSCLVCTWSETVIFNLSQKKETKILPILEAERKAYCTDFKNNKGFLHDLEKLASIFPHDELKYDFSKIRMLKVADMEKILSEVLQPNQFVKLQLEPPKITGHMAIRFSIHDTSERTEPQSIKALKKIITQALWPTNWRLMGTEINYRLGYLTGQLKGVDQKEDLQKIAAEITAKP